jgi:hypothetical protein
MILNLDPQESLQGMAMQHYSAYEKITWQEYFKSILIN